MEDGKANQPLQRTMLLAARALLAVVGVVAIGVAIAMWTGAIVTLNQTWWAPVVIAGGGVSLLFCAFLEAPAAVLGSLLIGLVAWN